MALLETLLSPALAPLNRQLRQSDAALDLANQLAGQQLAVRLRDSALAVGLAIDPDGLRLSDVSEPDLIIEGSIPGLLRLLGPDSRAAIRDGSVTVIGDVEVAGQIQDLLALGRPDVGDELSRLVGDDAASGIVDAVTRLREFGRERLKNVGEQLAERVAERQDLPRSDEMADFVGDVRALRDRTARLAASIEQLQKRRER
ncbi:MAG: SCP2 sterol-binding domain-containing protein [Pseudomonadota bacterium]